jgi:hypothetical protein
MEKFYGASYKIKSQLIANLSFQEPTVEPVMKQGAFKSVTNQSH